MTPKAKSCEVDVTLDGINHQYTMTDINGSRSPARLIAGPAKWVGGRYILMTADQAAANNQVIPFKHSLLVEMKCLNIQYQHNYYLDYGAVLYKFI
ncbi:hypothetical protein [Pseudoalteromonas denitrificans]|jgi:hypothetical protein|uniref:Uncharacterized protein n=1 Tax=Pseudoalteromonas denitrificans DSM 6059 TaxID=1123010 RepID=A0A1I1Q8A5_9GAMM|nr:hypothetical protein [Pseudoalteromonas denitrificans]SFD18202.1 hypothetical protein SAMN02745724_03773 [Pseudoalteromonas denitrificans DSM 6059]